MKSPLPIWMLAGMGVLAGAAIFVAGHSTNVAVVLGLGAFVGTLCILHIWFREIPRWQRSAIGAALGLAIWTAAGLVAGAGFNDVLVGALFVAAFGWFFEDLAKVA